MSLRETWHPVSFSATLLEAPIAVELLGERLVIWRDGRGVAQCSTDVCVHRGTALSGGCVQGDTIVCPYHGWRFDASGKCVLIPQLEDQSAIPPKARIAVHACIDLYGLIWVTLEKTANRSPWEQPVIAQFSDPTWRWVNAGPYEWVADSSRQLENFTDFGHFPFVHPGLLGDVERTVVPDYEVRTDGHVLHYRITRPEATNADDYPVFGNSNTVAPTRNSRYEVHLPYTLLLHLDWGGAEGMVYLFASQPVGPNMCRGYVVIGRNYNLDQPDSVLQEFEDVIFGQDQKIVESQRPSVVPFDRTAEVHLKFDAVALAYRNAMTANGFADSKRKIG